MTKAAIWALLILATASVVVGLIFFSDTLIQIVLAAILFIGVGGMARWFKRNFPILPRWAAGVIALTLIFSLLGLVVTGIVENVGQFRNQSGAYQVRINQIVADTYSALGVHSPAPTLKKILSGLDAGEVTARIAGAVQGVVGNAIFIIIYLGFLIAAALRVSLKFDHLFPKQADRIHASNVLTAVRQSMEQYLWMQTVISAITTILTYFTLIALGLEHAFFWSSLIFLLNFIPTIGALASFILPTLFALVQFPDIAQPALVGVSIFSIHFVIGHFLQPRMMGQSLNLSALIVLLSLELWGKMWGIAGAFLAAPLTVMIMIVLAQFSNTRWISVLLSADGKPLLLSPKNQAEAGPNR